MKKFTFGVDYYPEHWDESRWEKDADMMRELGLRFVRLAEFSWHKMEPREGEFHFEWLDRVIEILRSRGIISILGTPSAAPPKWIIDDDPEILPMDENGLRRHFGGRHHDCQSNEHYRAHIRRFVTAMAEHFKDNPAVAGWQIDNELGNSHLELCYCPSCTNRFRLWLKEKYETVDVLNRAWGTYFWSQEYDSFEQVDAPLKTVTGRNPSQMLDWKLFCSDLIVDFQQLQVDILRSICKNQFVTHNFMGFAPKVNYFDLAKSLDFVCHDQYTLLSVDEEERAEGMREPPHVTAALLDLMRGTKQAPFWVIEQQSSITGWTHMAPAPRPGQIRLWTAKSIAKGADAIGYFRWRSCLGGTEQYWHGILPHSGIPARAYEEIKETVKDLTPILEEVQGAMPKNKAALLFSYDQEYAFEIQPHHPKLTYLKHVSALYQGFFRHHAGMDFISDEADFEKYSLLIAPMQYLMTKERQQKFERFVKNGGTLVLTMRSGVKDEYNICMSHRSLPGDLSDLAGVEITEYDCLRDFSGTLCFPDGTQGTCGKWSDVLTLKGAQPVVCYDSEFYRGAPAVSVNAYGKGFVYYIGTEPDEKTMERLAKEILSKAGIRDDFEGVEAEVSFRETAENSYAFLLNHTEKDIDFTPPAGWQPILGDGQKLPPYGVCVLKK